MSAGPIEHHVRVTDDAALMLRDVRDARVRRKLVDAINALKHNPEQQGKPMVGGLKGLRSKRAIGQRYRIIYAIHRTEVTVTVVAVGLRKAGDKNDIYAVVARMRDRDEI